jgi:hypothetical protein
MNVNTVEDGAINKTEIEDAPTPIDNIEDITGDEICSILSMVLLVKLINMSATTVLKGTIYETAAPEEKTGFAHC